MNKSEIMRAAHKLAKAYKKKAGGFGDYIVYLQRAMKKVHKSSSESALNFFPRLNNYLQKNGIEKLVRIRDFRSVKVATVTEKYSNKIKAPKKGQTLGKIFKNNDGTFSAYVYEQKLTNIYW